MRHLLRLLCAVLPALALIGCSNHAVDRSFDRVATLIASDSAEEALKLLNNIDTLGLKSESERARFALLLCHARYKNYIDDTTYTLLRPALDYYVDGSHGPKADRALALFLKGNVNFAKRSYSSAIVDFLKAEAVARSLRPGHDNTLLLAFIRQSIADCYAGAFCFNDQLRMSIKAADAFIQSGDSTYICGAYGDIAHSYLNTLQFEKALVYVDTAFAIERKHPNPYMRNLGDLVKARAYAGLEDGMMSLRYYDKIFKTRPKRLNYSDFLYIRKYLGEVDGGFPELRAWSTDSNSNPLINSEMSLLKMTAQRLETAIRQNVTSSVHALTDRELDHSERQNRAKTTAIIVLSILLTAIVLLSLKVYFTQKRLNNTQIELLQSKISDLDMRLSHIDSSRIAIAGKHKQTIDLYCSQIDHLIGKIGKDVMISKNSDPDKKLQLLSDSLVKGGIIKSLIEFFNDNNDMVIDRLRKDVQPLSEDEITIFSLSAMHFSSATICLIQKIDKKSLYNRRDYFKSKIKKSGSEYIDRFLALL